MELLIRDHGVRASRDGRIFAADRFEHALSSVREHIRRVTVYIGDENGLRGGDESKSVLAIVTLVNGRSIPIDIRGDSLIEAVEVAAQKVSRLVCEEISRRNGRQRMDRLLRAFANLRRRIAFQGAKS